MADDPTKINFQLVEGKTLSPQEVEILRHNHTEIEKHLTAIYQVLKDQGFI